MTRGALVLAVLAAAAAALGLTAAGDGGERAGRLVWASAPRHMTPPALPTDAVLSGEVRNDGLRTVTLTAAAVRVLDANGRRLRVAARFLEAFAPGGAGRSVTLAPGRTTPLTVAWRGPRARLIVIGAMTLDIPR